MSGTDFEEYLENRYNDQISWYSKKSSTYKRYYQYLQWIAIITSVSIPVLVMSLSGNHKWFTAGLSIVLAIVTAGLKTFKYQENWLNYRTIAETLKKEKHYFDARIGDYTDVDCREQVFVERVEALISMENTLWITLHRRREDTNR